MLVIPNRKALILRLREPGRVINLVPTSRLVKCNGSQYIAVPHRLDETRVLRNLDIAAPSPIRFYYDWPGMHKPFDAQLGTAEFLTLNRNAFVLSDLGTGKTLSTLWAYDYLRSLGELHRALVVSPLSALERTWGDEIFRNFPELTFSVLHGTREKRMKLLRTETDIYVINHDGIKTAGFVEALTKRPDIDLVIVDELAQVGRNSGTDRWRALNKICNKQTPRRVWGLTGTPTPNAPTDAWAQCKLVAPGRVPTYFNRFRDQVMRQVTQFKWVPRDTAAQTVCDVMQPAVRYSRDDCVDLPPCIYETRTAEFTPEQKKAYKQMMNTLRAESEAGEILAVNEAVKIAKLVQIACGVAYGPHGEEIAFPTQGRLDVLEEVIEQAGTKVIVFVPFVAALQHVAEHLESKGVTVGVIHGSVSKNERDRIFKAFQQGSDPRVLVAQPAAMSHSLTLTAANTIVWFAPITSNETYTQANGRITRPGQTQTQFIINIEGSYIERKLYERLRDRQSLQGLLLHLVQGGSGTS